MITMLHKEQEDDFHHKDWCENENGASDAKIENLESANRLGNFSAIRGTPKLGESPLQR